VQVRHSTVNADLLAYDFLENISSVVKANRDLLAADASVLTPLSLALIKDSPCDHAAIAELARSAATN
jgi:hypothetical protein